MSFKVLTVCIMFLVNALLTRLLDQNDAGIYFLIVSQTAIFSVIAQYGLIPASVRFISEAIGADQKARVRSIVLTVFKIAGTSIFSVCFLYYIGIGDIMAKMLWKIPSISSLTPWITLWIAALALRNIFGAIFRGFYDIRMFSIFGGFSTSLLTLFFFAGFYFYSLGATSLHELVAVSVFSLLFSTGLAGIFIYKKVSLLPESAGKLRVGEVHQVALPLLFINLINVLMKRADLWILGVFYSGTTLAIYGAASRLLLFVFFPMMMVVSIIAPLISRLYVQGRTVELERILRLSATCAALPASLLFISLIGYSRLILEVIFGESYSGGGVILIILSIGQLINACSGNCMQLLTMTGHEKVVFYLNICGLFIAALGSLLTVNILNELGVALSFSVAVALVNILMTLYSYKKLGIKTYPLSPLRAVKKIISH